MYALLSCDRDRQSWEFPELGHGVFTYYLMQGLRGEAADAQGLIDADGLYKYVYHQTLQYIDKTNQQLRPIDRQKRGRGESQFHSEILLQELDRSFGDLPLLEFVLEQLWEHRRGGALTLQAYLQKIGGLKGAIERKAQAVYDSLDPQAQTCAQWIFLNLTQLGEGTEDTRRRILKSELVVKKYSASLVEKTLQA